MSVQYVIGDATRPVGEGPKFIVHVVNDVGGWGRGFVVALSQRWREPEQRYRAWHRGEFSQPFALGEVQLVPVADQLWVANLIGQHGIRTIGGVAPVRYAAIRTGLRRIAAEARRLAASVHLPRIGCGLAGGHWDVVGKMIEEELDAQGISVTVYDLAA